MQNSDLFLNIGRFIVLIVVQILLFNHINFLGYVNPYPYILFILIFPFTGNKSLLIFLGFLLGLSVDIFSDSGGVHAAACVFLAYIRPLLLKFSFGVSYEFNTIKLSKADFGARITYISAAVVAHHLVLFSLEIFNISHIVLVLKSTLFSSIFTIILLFCITLLFSRKN
ncbi:rod shape-determining protein MreD [Marinirhabdus gelatinilytica]|uniref:Rod shape-determining protein MreD n=1 Tax=Marinirhabdus gelatinilytica TaxID=1703343 RepID=A0A370QM54_9FLAO|nr:rod shape-determining protein MreD [Marinirhabdus gelatinilytica]RDK89100.1 rod shape-determining protein MreD [Marinirhabdus gelatinilytica]